MSKVCVIGDMHLSLKNGDPTMFKHHLKFLNWVTRFCEEKGIRDVYQTGDIFDTRRILNNNISFHIQKFFQEQGLEWHILLGNHDTYSKTSNQVNTPETILSHYVTLVKDDLVTVGSVDFIPWISPQNQEKIMRQVAESNSRFCIGHFEFQGFDMGMGHLAEHGMSHKLFQKYEKVLSGHYHTKSQKDNVIYVGTPYQITFIDHDETKGVHIFDTETGELEFHEYPEKFFLRLEYDDGLDFDLSTVTDKWIRLTIKQKTDEKVFDKFEKELNSHSPADLKIIENMVKHSESYQIENVDISKATEIMAQYINQTDFIGIDKTELNRRMEELYGKAMLE
jgi:DNA repair exonuclease SbcCD nuclease subunit